MERKIRVTKNISRILTWLVPVCFLVLFTLYITSGIYFLCLYLIVYTIPTILLHFAYLATDFRKKVTITEKQFFINDILINKSDVELVKCYSARLSHFGESLNPYRFYSYYEIIGKNGEHYLLTNLMVSGEELKIDGLNIKEVITFYPLPYPIKSALYGYLLKFWR